MWAVKRFICLCIEVKRLCHKKIFVVFDVGDNICCEKSLLFLLIKDKQHVRENSMLFFILKTNYLIINSFML